MNLPDSDDLLVCSNRRDRRETTNKRASVSQAVT